MRILIADDNEANREFLIEALEARGHSVRSACNGRQALAAIEKEDFEVVLMDEEMPVMDGIEATRAIHQRRRSGENCPVIIGLSGNFTDEDKNRCLEAGMNAFLPKPVGIDELVETIRIYGRSPQSNAVSRQYKIEIDAPPVNSPQNIVLHLHKITGGNEKLQQSLVKTFLADTSKKLYLLRKAVSQSDAAQLASVAHSMKGSLGLVGAHQAMATAQDLQSKGKLGNLDGAATDLRTLEDQFKRLRQELLAL